MPRQYDPRKLKKETPKKQVADEYQQSRQDWSRQQKAARAITNASKASYDLYAKAFGRKKAK